MSVEQFEARFEKGVAAVEKTRKQYDKAYSRFTALEIDDKQYLAALDRYYAAVEDLMKSSQRLNMVSGMSSPRTRTVIWVVITTSLSWAVSKARIDRRRNGPSGRAVSTAGDGAVASNVTYPKR